MDIPEIDVVELADRRDDGALVIDVREPDEWLTERVPGTVLIPLGEVAERIDEVPTSGTVYVICGSGPRSARAVEHYRSVGIDAVNVAGGTTAWAAEGFPTVSGPGGP
jgi:rhodanese-related sulfurtransferase